MRRGAEVEVVLSGRDQFVAKLLALLWREDRHGGILMDWPHAGCEIPILPKSRRSGAPISFRPNSGSLRFGNICSCLLRWTDLRRLTVAQSLLSPTTLKRALHRMRFVQADPIRAPARAQDLILRHRVKDYRAGDLERRYTKLGIEEDFFINYGFVTREMQALMHPRSDSCVPAEARLPWPAARRKRAHAAARVRARAGHRSSSRSR